MPYDTSLELFETLSLHSLTRAPSDWHHEMCMHRRLCGEDKALHLSLANMTMNMPTSTRLLPGTAAALNSIEVSDDFYWIPTEINLHGIDGVLGDSEHNIYAVQAAIANRCSSPFQGLQDIWDNLPPAVRKDRIWHFVIVGKEKSTVDDIAVGLSGRSRGLSIGSVKVKVWGCVIRS